MSRTPVFADHVRSSPIIRVPDHPRSALTRRRADLSLFWNHFVISWDLPPLGTSFLHFTVACFGSRTLPGRSFCDILGIFRPSGLQFCLCCSVCCLWDAPGTLLGALWLILDSSWCNCLTHSRSFWDAKSTPKSARFEERKKHPDLMPQSSQSETVRLRKSLNFIGGVATFGFSQLSVPLRFGVSFWTHFWYLLGAVLGSFCDILRLHLR